MDCFFCNFVSKHNPFEDFMVGLDEMNVRDGVAEIESRTKTHLNELVSLTTITLLIVFVASGAFAFNGSDPNMIVSIAASIAGLCALGGYVFYKFHAIILARETAMNHIQMAAAQGILEVILDDTGIMDQEAIDAVSRKVFFGSEAVIEESIDAAQDWG